MPVESFTARHPRYVLTFIVVSLVFILFHVISPPHPGARWGPRPPPFDFASRAEVNCGRMTGEQGWEHPPHHWGPPPAHDGRPSAWGPPPEHHHHHEHKPFWGPHDGHAEGMPPPAPHWYSEHGSHHNGPPPPHFWGPPPPGHRHHDHPEGMPPPPAHWSDEDEHHHHHHGPPPPHFWGPPPHGHEDHGDFQERPPRPEHYHQGPPPHRHEDHHDKQGNDEELIPQSDVESLRCPHTMQLLGESWVCGFERIAAQEQCVVYSIGVAGESSFEGSVLKESEGCMVFGYDSKAESFGAGHYATNGHDFIDILKIELNDEDDFIALEALLNEFEGPKQILLRGNPAFLWSDPLDGQVRGERPLAAIFEKIQRMGMSPFFAGPSASKDALDYAFISIPREHKHKVDAETPAPVVQV
ncbi:hypothetical protein CPB85DRAFT_1433887 [Mucidula mucida]|nr:hypothetical protein CPB85DRAFT_1433887 [Mucidula mucida]